MQPQESENFACGKTLLTVCTLVLGASLAFAGTPKISSDLKRNNVSVESKYNNLSLGRPAWESYQQDPALPGSGTGLGVGHSRRCN
jgi:hypothetical protein